jgi:hypothetical protein
MIVDFIRSRSKKPKKPQAKDAEAPVPLELLARVDGRDLALGPLDGIRRIVIGSGLSADIPLAAKGIEGRHATMVRKGDFFVIKNHAPTPFTVRGVPVPPRRRARIVLPAEIVFNETTRVLLSVRQQANPDASVKDKEDNHVSEA